MNKPIFISHAVKDKTLADALVDLLQVGMNISSHKIFCSSLEGLGIPQGENFVDYIKGQIQEPQIVIALISPNYFASQFCMCELGAAWAMSHRLLPLLVPPLKYDDVKGVLTGIQLISLTDADRLSEFMDRVSSSLSHTVPSVARWEIKRDKFVKEMPKLLKKITNPDSVSQAEHKKVQDKLFENKKALEESDTEVERLNALVTELSAAKDKCQVLSILKAHQPASETLDRLENTLREGLKGINRSVAFVAFNELSQNATTVLNGERDPDFNRHVEEAAARKIVSIDDHGNAALNTSHPKLRGIQEAFNALANFLDNECPVEIFEQFENEHGFPMTVENRDYWEYAIDPRLTKV